MTAVLAGAFFFATMVLFLGATGGGVRLTTGSLIHDQVVTITVTRVATRRRAV